MIYFMLKNSSQKTFSFNHNFFIMWINTFYGNLFKTFHVSEITWYT